MPAIYGESASPVRRSPEKSVHACPGAGRLGANSLALLACFRDTIAPFLRHFGSGLIPSQGADRACGRFFASALVAATLAGGCAMGPAETIPPPPSQVQQGTSAPSGVVYSSPFGASAPAVPLPNPLPVPVADLDFAWEQIVAVIEEDFKIAHEERVRLCGDILTEGRIDTVPLTASTLLESLAQRLGHISRSLVQHAAIAPAAMLCARDSGAGSIPGRSARR